MSITFRILGAAGRDNALWVQVDSGQAVDKLLFDCGDGCLSDLSFSEVQAVDRLFFSHLHMDHIGGFDTFFRCTFDRQTKPNWIYGPPGTAAIMQHRFQGFLWNLHDSMAASWLVSDVNEREIHTARFELAEAFALKHGFHSRSFERTICEGVGCSVEAFTMNHRTPTLAYIVREKPRRNVETSRLAALNLKPGPWLKQLKDSEGTGSVVINGTTYSLAELQKQLVVETPGDSIAYLTDFLLDDAAIERLAGPLSGCRVLVCECQYRHADEALALKNYHMTTRRAATLAARAGVQELILFHLSDRYEPGDWADMLREAREIFPAARYPWQIEATS